MRVLGVHCRRCLERSDYGRGEPYGIGCCTVLYCSIAIADLCCRVRVSLWLLCYGAALRVIVSAVDCSYVCVSPRCVHACVTAALQWESGVALCVFLAVVGRGRVCNAAPPLCVTTVLTSMLGALCSGVRSCGAVCLDVCVYVAL